MAGLRDIKIRIKSVNSTRQITKAMNLVATAKLKKSRDRVEGIRPYFNELQTVVKNIIASSEDVQNEFFSQREVKKSLFIVIAADRGLCGGYNANVIKKAALDMEGKEAAIIAVGGRSRDFFRIRNYDIKESFVEIGEQISYKDAQSIASKAIELYQKNEVDEVFVVFNRFISTIQYEPTAIHLLPLSLDEIKADSEEAASAISPIYDPSPNAVLDVLIPKYIAGTVYGALLEAAASEQSSRMTAMSSATDNATKMIGELTLYYNRARQASITTEISEIVGGAEALK